MCALLLLLLSVHIDAPPVVHSSAAELPPKPRDLWENSATIDLGPPSFSSIDDGVFWVDR